MELGDINRIVIAGTGTMGASIAQIFAKGGYCVTLYGRSENSLEKGRKSIAINQDVSIKEGDISRDESMELRERIRFSKDLDCFRDADFVIEAIVEDLETKLSFWAMVSTLAPLSAVLTTNTSGLSITKIAEAVKKPERFGGMHWVNPPHIVPLVEIIHGAKTDGKTIQLIADIATKIGKKPVILKKEARGFILNRLQFCVLREAMHIVESGIASTEDVDDVFKYGLGMRYACLGPFEIADLGGLDVFKNIADYLFDDLSDVKEPQKLLTDLVKAGDHGTKSGRGFYSYAEGKAEKAIKKRDRDFLQISKCLYK